MSNQSFSYRADITLDGSGGNPHHIYKSESLDKVFNAVWEHPGLRKDSVVIVWKEFNSGACRHVLTACPSSHKSVGDVIDLAKRRDAAINEPIPVPKEPPVKWV